MRKTNKIKEMSNTRVKLISRSPMVVGFPWRELEVELVLSPLFEQPLIDYINDHPEIKDGDYLPEKEPS